MIEDEKDVQEFEEWWENVWSPTMFGFMQKVVDLQEENEKLKIVIARLRGEASDAGGKSLRRGKRHFSSMPE